MKFQTLTGTETDTGRIQTTKGKRRKRDEDRRSISMRKADRGLTGEQQTEEIVHTRACGERLETWQGGHALRRSQVEELEAKEGKWKCHRDRGLSLICT